jgi:hypothetical protein
MLSELSMLFFGIMVYLYGFSVGAREFKFYYYGLLFLALGWIPQIINLMNPEIQDGLMHINVGQLIISLIIAVGFTIVTFVLGYLSGRYYRLRK